MKKVSRKPRTKGHGDLRPEYDFRKGERGKFATRYASGTNVVVLDPDVAALFATSKAVNDALRALAGIVRAVRARRRPGRKSA
ncbi:MAG: hypothetical protein L0Z51_08230 [Candidatus Latescibacteria bacterium]|nr:hypothetical protein [Candidatus Latescibacterota bacterium]